MQNVFELLITVLLVGAGCWVIYWLLGLLKGKVPEVVNTVLLVFFVVIVIVALYTVAFRGFRLIQL